MDNLWKEIDKRDVNLDCPSCKGKVIDIYHHQDKKGWYICKECNCIFKPKKEEQMSIKAFTFKKSVGIHDTMLLNGLIRGDREVTKMLVKYLVKNWSTGNKVSLRGFANYVADFEGGE